MRTDLYWQAGTDGGASPDSLPRKYSIQAITTKDFGIIFFRPEILEFMTFLRDKIIVRKYYPLL